MKNGLAETGIMKTGYEDAKWILLGQAGFCTVFDG
jgi:hypothetical protein